jgi:hypothetical protein
MQVMRRGGPGCSTPSNQIYCMHETRNVIVTEPRRPTHASGMFEEAASHTTSLTGFVWKQTMYRRSFVSDWKSPSPHVIKK